MGYPQPLVQDAVVHLPLYPVAIPVGSYTDIICGAHLSGY